MDKDKAKRREELSIAASDYSVAVTDRVRMEDMLACRREVERKARDAYYKALSACYADELAVVRDAQKEAKQCKAQN